jgi:hypothetical protein
MNILLIAAALANATTGAGAARGQVCKGPHPVIEHRPDQQTVIRHSGVAGDPATVIRRGPQGEIVVEQSGPCNEAQVTQGGSHNRSVVRQNGSGNRVTVTQGATSGGRP